jgi:putative Holliday junction resolvase
MNTTYNRVMAVDYGDVRTGVAFSDLTRTLAGELLTITERSAVNLAAQLAELAKSRLATVIVLGYPLNMDDSQNARTEKTEKLAERLRNLGFEVAFVDERLTSVAAHELLRQNGTKTKNHKGKVDAVAASLILEEYLSLSAKQ